MNSEQEIWDFLHTHLRSIFTRDAATYRATTGADLSLCLLYTSPSPRD